MALFNGGFSTHTHTQGVFILLAWL